MKSLLFISIFIFPFSSFAQIKLPKFLTGGGNKTNQEVKWSCEAPPFKGVSGLPSERVIKVRFDGENLKLKPDIFSKQILTGRFLKKTFNNVVKKNKEQYYYDYSECIDQLVKDVSSKFGDNAGLVLKNNIDHSYYFKKEKNKVFIPTYPKINLDDFQKVMGEEVLRAYKNSFSLGLAEIKERLNHAKNLLAEYENIVCERAEELCSNLKLKNSAYLDNFEKLLGRYEEDILSYENSRFKFEKERLNGTEKEFSDIDKFFDNEDLSSCDFLNRTSSSFSSLYFDKALEKNLDKIIDTGNSFCLKNLLQNYLVNRSYKIRPSEAYREFCLAHNTPSCQNISTASELVLKNYEKIFAAIYGDTGLELYSKIVSCDVDLENPVQSLLNEVNKNKELLECLPLSIGDSKTTTFTMKRTSDKDYDIYYNLSFSGGKASDRASLMEDRVRTCAAEISPFLKGPKGESLTLHILNEEEINKLPAKERPVKQNITVEEAGFRSNSGAYEENIGCDVITHELLHKLGLLDEYQETQRSYACRVVPKVSSIMKLHWEAFDKGVQKVTTCSCREDFCKNIINSEDQKLKEIYLGSNIYELTDYNFRTKYCESKDNSNKINYDTLSDEEKKTTTIVSESETSVVVKSLYISSSFPKINDSVLTCTCEPNDNTCLDGIKKIKETVSSLTSNSTKKYCPEGTMTGNSKIGSLPGTGYRIVDKNNFEISPKKEWKSILYSNQFDRIMAMNCMTAGVPYRECSRYAYSNNPEDCEKVPKECFDDQYYLGVLPK